MTDTERSLHVDSILTQGGKSIALAASSMSCAIVCWLRLVGAAAQQLREETCKTEANGRHAHADDAHFPFNHRPEGSFEVVPCHICGIREMDEGTEADDGYDCYARVS